MTDLLDPPLPRTAHPADTAAPAGPPSPAPAPGDGSRPRRSSRWIVAWFGIVITLPAVLGLVGVRSHPAENRAPAEMPRLGGDALLHDATYRAIGAWFEDHLPGRDQAVAANRGVDLDVLGDSPNPRVVRGERDTLFLTDAWQLVCDQPRSAGELASRLGGVADALAARGPDAHVLLVPDKTFVLGDELANHPGVACADARRAGLRAAPRHPRVADPYPAFESATAAGGRTFWRGDSHASFEGEGLLLEAIVDQLEPGLWARVPRRALPPVDETMDLWFLLGEDRTERGRRTVVDRVPATTATAHDASAPAPPAVPLDQLMVPTVPSLVLEFETSGDGPVVEGNTLIIGDSQMQRLAVQLAPYFRHLTVRIYPGLAFEMPDVSHDLADVDHLLVESVERGAYVRFFDPNLGARLGIDI